MKKKRRNAATTAETSRGSIVARRVNNEPSGELFVVFVLMTVEDTPGHERGAAAQSILALRPNPVSHAFRDAPRSHGASRCYDFIEVARAGIA
jgi:hypothetical protein